MKRFSKKNFFDSESDGIFSDSVNSGVLLPVYHGRNGREYLYAALVVLLSSLTDLFDGKIARRFSYGDRAGKGIGSDR